MNDHDDIRDAVARSYARAVTRPRSGGCCGAPDTTCDYARRAGYTDEDIERLPRDAVTSSFGCGNPLAFSDVEPGQTVLDLGSGAGIDLLIAARKVGRTGHVIGVDMTDEMIDRARANVAASALENVEVRKGIIENMPVENASVDWVISNCVINLSPDKTAVFREIARVLKPGGRMSVSDIVVKELPDWVRRDIDLHAGCVAGAVSEEEYLDGLRQAGLEDVEVSERLPIDASLIASAWESVAPNRPAGTGGCGCAPGNADTLTRAVTELAGKVWSARFHARKPGRDCPAADVPASPDRA